jgi:FkbM family methyltransferase
LKLLRRLDRIRFCFKISQSFLDGCFLLYFTVLHFILLRFYRQRLIEGHGFRQFDLCLENKDFSLCLRVQDIPVFYEIFQLEVYKFKNDSTSADQLIFDLGAHIGLFTVYTALHTLSTFRFICVEPVPENLMLLRKNIDINQINATILNKAIGSNEMEYMLLDHTRLGYKINRSENGSLKAAVISISSLIEEFGKPEGIKMDIEGAEESIFEEFKSLDQVQWVWIEIHQANSRIPTLLREAGMDIREANTQVYFAKRKAS